MHKIKSNMYAAADAPPRPAPITAPKPDPAPADTPDPAHGARVSQVGLCAMRLVFLSSSKIFKCDLISQALLKMFREASASNVDWTDWIDR